MKKPKIFRTLRKFMTSEEVVGQGIAAAIKFPLSMLMTDLGAKAIFTLTGLGIGLANEAVGKKKTQKIPGFKKRYSRKELVREAAANMMMTWSDPTADQMIAIKGQTRDLISGIRYGKFGTAFGSLIEEPHKIAGAIKGMVPSKFGSLKFNNPFKGKFGAAGFRLKKLTRAVAAAKEVTPGLVTKYGSEDDIISY